jgi:hypothetical protein
MAARDLTFQVRRPSGRPARTVRPVRARRTYTRGQLLAAIRRWVDRYGEPPASADWEPSRARRIGHAWRAERFEAGRWPSMRMVRTEFGSLNAAIREAGFEPRPSPTRVRTQIRDPDEILRAIREWAALYGEPPAMSDWDPSRARRNGHQWRIDRYRAGDWPSTRTVCAHFGNFRRAVAAAGLEPRAQGRHAARTPAYEAPRLSVVEHGYAVQKEAFAPLLTQRVHDVVHAQRAGDGWALRGALVDLAATALEWAEALDGDYPASALEALAIRRASAGRAAA